MTPLLTTAQVADRIGFSAEWVRKNRHLFRDVIELRGRGCTRTEYRFTEASVAEYIRRRREAGSLAEIISEVKTQRAPASA